MGRRKKVGGWRNNLSLVRNNAAITLINHCASVITITHLTILSYRPISFYSYSQQSVGKFYFEMQRTVLFDLSYLPIIVIVTSTGRGSCNKFKKRTTDRSMWEIGMQSSRVFSRSKEKSQRRGSDFCEPVTRTLDRIVYSSRRSRCASSASIRHLFLFIF